VLSWLGQRARPLPLQDLHGLIHQGDDGQDHGSEPWRGRDARSAQARPVDQDRGRHVVGLYQDHSDRLLALIWPAARVVIVLTAGLTFCGSGAPGPVVSWRSRRGRLLGDGDPGQGSRLVRTIATTQDRYRSVRGRVPHTVPFQAGAGWVF